MKKIDLTPSKKEIHSYKEFLNSGYGLSNCTIQNIDFTSHQINWDTLELDNTVFLGCSLSQEDTINIIKKGGYIFPKNDKLPYNPYRDKLYTWQELYKETSPTVSIDLEIYNRFEKTKYDPTMMESLWQRIHDHSIDDALRDFLKPNAKGEYKIKSIGIMGGHSTNRDNPYFKKVARTAQLLAQNGYLVMSGGGPGTMEAANLGAYMKDYSENDLYDAIDHMKTAPHYTHTGFNERAIEVLSKYPNGNESLAIPTWFYGHEPSNVFASHIAKYFSNSIREDTLLAISIHGILFAPGSAGTTQEIFMDAAQNHYTTFEYISPMIFMGKKRYTEDTQLFQTIQDLSKDKPYGKMVKLVEEPNEALEAFLSLPPEKINS